MRYVRQTVLFRPSAFWTALLRTSLFLLLLATALAGPVVLTGHAAQRQATGSQLTGSQLTGPRLADTTSTNAFVSDLTSRRSAGRVGVEEAPKSPGRATALSLGGTLLLAPAFGAGLFIGPAFGHFYAENHSQAWQGIALRGGTAIAALAAAESSGGGSSGPDGDFDGLGEALAWLAVGAGVVIGSGIYDIATAGDAAREYNRERRLKSARVAPTAGGPQGEQIGLSVRIEF